MQPPKRGLYTIERLIPELRAFAKARDESLSRGFSDNGGALASMERVLDILSQRICYPHLTHIQKLKIDPNAECSVAADRARRAGKKVEIEHVTPHRAFTISVADRLREGISDEALIGYVRMNFRLILLTVEERKALDKKNRTRISDDRLAELLIKRSRKDAQVPKRPARSKVKNLAKAKDVLEAPKSRGSRAPRSKSLR